MADSYLSTFLPSVEDDITTRDDAPEVFLGLKLFVGQVPRGMEEDELMNFMQNYGTIQSVVVIRDRVSAVHRGCAFVTFADASAAHEAITTLHNKVTLPMSANPLQVRPADGQGVIPVQEHKLFIGMIPRTANEDQIRVIFEKYGVIDEVYILRHQQTGQSKGCAFLKYKEHECALLAIEHVHGRITMGGSAKNGSTNSTLVVRMADSRRQRLQRNRDATGSGSGSGSGSYWNANGNSSYPTGQMHPAQYMPPSNYNMSTQYASQGNLYASDPYAPQDAGNYVPQNYSPNIYLPTEYEQHPPAAGPLEGNDYYTPYTYPGYEAYAPTGGVVAYSGYVPPAGMEPTLDITFGTAPHPLNAQMEGPMGANLFIYHLPHDLTDADLATAFAPFGAVISAKVYMDKVTGESKGFGFVSYDTSPAADAAICSMNGFQIGSKRLKVQHKRVRGREDSGSFEDSDSTYTRSSTNDNLRFGSEDSVDDNNTPPPPPGHTTPIEDAMGSLRIHNTES